MTDGVAEGGAVMPDPGEDEDKEDADDNDGSGGELVPDVRELDDGGDRPDDPEQRLAEGSTVIVTVLSATVSVLVTVTTETEGQELETPLWDEGDGALPEEPGEGELEELGGPKLVDVLARVSVASAVTPHSSRLWPCGFLC